MDIDAIALGEDFVKAIETTVAKCDVLIAVIGNNWLTSKDNHGDRRLDKLAQDRVLASRIDRWVQDHAPR